MDDKIISELFDLEKHHQSLIQFQSLASAHQYKPLYNLMKKFVPRGSKVLDWGSGNGHFSYYLLRCGFKVTGFTIGETVFPKVLNNPKYIFRKGKKSDPKILPFPKNSFDAVFSVGVLEHVRETGGDEISSLKEIKRILKPGGLFICFHFPNKYSLVEFISRLISKKFHHQYKFTEKDIKELVKKSGLKILTIRRYGILPRNSFNYFPFLRRSKTFAQVWDFLDKILGNLFSPICQNYLFVAKKL